MMNSVTIELPDTLSQAIQQRRIPRQRLEGAVISFLEFFVQEVDEESAAATAEPWSDGAAFAQRVIGHNRELFEALARL
jgi:hypothetical protein